MNYCFFNSGEFLAGVFELLVGGSHVDGGCVFRLNLGLNFHPLLLRGLLLLCPRPWTPVYGREVTVVEVAVLDTLAAKLPLISVLQGSLSLALYR
jgi:hypothetical protein